MLVTASDLSLYMDYGFNNRMVDTAEIVLAGIQSEVETHLRRPIEVQEFDEDYVVPEDYLMISASAYFYDRSINADYDALAHVVQPPFQLHLRNAPVASVSLVRLKGRLDTTWRTLVVGRDYQVTRWGVDIWSAFQYDTINVVYEAGLDGTQIPYLKLIILRAAAREMQTRVDDVVGIKDMQTNEAVPTTIGLTEDEKKALKRWKRKTP